MRLLTDLYIFMCLLTAPIFVAKEFGSSPGESMVIGLLCWVGLVLALGGRGDSNDS